MNLEEPVILEELEDNPTPETSSRNDYRTEGRGLIKEGGEWFASLGGKEEEIAVSPALGDAISIALRVQDKVDETLIAKHRPGLLSRMSLLNCRKAIWAVRNPQELRRLLNLKTLKSGAKMTQEESESISGVEELKEDLEEILSSGGVPIVGSMNDMHLKEYLNEHTQDFPVVVHVFNATPEKSSGIISRLFSTDSPLSSEYCMKVLHRNHTILVLGKNSKGDFIGFHKQGPRAFHQLELASLDSIVEHSVVPKDGRIYFSFVGPINPH